MYAIYNVERESESHTDGERNSVHRTRKRDRAHVFPFVSTFATLCDCSTWLDETRPSLLTFRSSVDGRAILEATQIGLPNRSDSIVNIFSNIITSQPFWQQSTFNKRASYLKESLKNAPACESTSGRYTFLLVCCSIPAQSVLGRSKKQFWFGYGLTGYRKSYLSRLTYITCFKAANHVLAICSSLATLVHSRFAGTRLKRMPIVCLLVSRLSFDFSTVRRVYSYCSRGHAQQPSILGGNDRLTGSKVA